MGDGGGASDVPNLRRWADVWIGLWKAILTGGWIFTLALALTGWMLRAAEWPDSSPAPYAFLRSIDLFPATAIAVALALLRVAVRDVPRVLWSRPRRKVREWAGHLPKVRPARAAQATEITPATTSGDLRASNADSFEEGLSALCHGLPESAYSDLALRMSSPSDFQLRVSEEFSVADKLLTHRVGRTVSLACAIPDATPRESPLEVPRLTVVPVLRVRKGELLDHLTAKVSEGSITVLSFAENQGATAHVLLALFENVRNRALGGKKPKDLRNSLSECFAAAIDPDADVRNALPHLRALSAGLDDAVSRLPPTARVDASNAVAAFVGMARYFFSCYVVFAAVTSDRDRVTITTERDIPVAEATPASARGRRQSEGGDGVLLAGLGKPTTTYRLFLGHLVEAPSYHVYFTPPEGTYVYRRCVGVAEPRRGAGRGLWVVNFETAGSGDRGPFGPRLSISPTVSYLHFYARDASQVISRAIPTPPRARSASAVHPLDASIAATKLFVEVRERPPGFAASMLAVVTYLVAIAVTLTFFNRYLIEPKTMSSVLAALAVGAPSLATAWLGAKLGGDNRGRTSVLLLWSAVALMAAAVAFGVSGGAMILKAALAPQGTTVMLSPAWSSVWVFTLSGLLVVGLFVVQRFAADVARYALRERAAGSGGA